MESSLEQWLPAVGWEGLYEVSDQGRVRSLDRVTVGIDGLAQRRRGQPIKPVRHWTGYSQVMFRRTKDGVKEAVNVLVHVAVLDAFVGVRPDGLEAAHGNGVREDNRLANLRWDTHQGNLADRDRHGTTARGERNGMARLTDADVVQIRSEYRRVSHKVSNSLYLAGKFGVTQTQINRIVRGAGTS